MSPRSLSPTAQANTIVRPKPARRASTVSTAISVAAPAMRAPAGTRWGSTTSTVPRRVRRLQGGTGPPSQLVQPAQHRLPGDDLGEADPFAGRGQARDHH